MNQTHTLRLATWARLVALSLLLLVGLLAGSLLASNRAHAQAASSVTITDCSDDTQLQSAVSSASSGETIAFGCSGTIPLSKTLTIAVNLTLDGSGQSVTLDGQGQVRALSVNSGVSFTLNALTIAHGSAPVDPSCNCSSGGGLLNEGGTVNISNSTFANNSASIGSEGGVGGGLLNEGGTLNISNSTFANNSASGSGLAETGGGGLYNYGTVSISNSTFASNSGGHGGGGLVNDGSDGIASVSISNSTFASNSAPVDPSCNCSSGGGLENFQGGTVSISNSTFAHNSASSGGGLEGNGTVTISNSTFASNSASSGGGLVIDRYGSTAFSGSIVANNSNGNCINDGGSISDQGDNLESGTDCGFTGTGSLQNKDPLLSGLANNGGPTQTMALQDESPAIDHIPAASCLASDQRGVSRLAGERCDIGAFEFPDTTAPTLSLPGTVTVDATSPQGAVVSYTARATDDDGDALTPTCAPASGNTFPIGTTAVNCSASESGSNTASGSFSVVVKGAAAQVNDLISLVNSFHLAPSLQTSLDNKLQDVLTAMNAGQTATACNELTDFIGLVQSHTGKGLTTSQANQLIAAAKQVQAVLGC